MTQSEAETQITRILSQLENDQGVIVESVNVNIIDISTMFKAKRIKKVEIDVASLPNVEWDLS